MDTLGPAAREDRAAQVEEFYTRSPFPGYAEGDDASVLLERCRRSSFLAGLDRAVPADGSFLSVGCGTAQVPAFLGVAGPKRRVLAVDGCMESLEVADRFVQKISLQNITLIRADIFDMPLPKERFDVVSCRGVIHHTPDPFRALDCVAQLVAPGGVLVLGYYETMGRAWHRMRRVLSTLRGRRPVNWLDPILRRKDISTEKKRIWIEDQYRHPLEVSLPTPRVLKHLEQRGFEFVRTVPPSPDGNLFHSTAKPGPMAMWFRRLLWMLSGVVDPDAGLVVLIVRKKPKFSYSK
ncbi:MAG: class I SAM-dependent methyltransferase [Planctomycetota bacterium]|nr:class I SAM-dependent methyltransferase [Planctomycetota bacterium]